MESAIRHSIVKLSWLSLVAAAPFEATFNNYKDFDVEIVFADGSASGILIGTIAAGSSFPLSTHVGHELWLIHRSGTHVDFNKSFRMALDQDQYSIGTPSSKHLVDEAMNKLRKETHGAVGFLHRTPVSQNTLPLSVTIVNFRRYKLERYWDDGSPNGVYQGHLPPLQSSDGITTYHSHAFKLFKKENGKLELVQRIVMETQTRVYVVEPEPDDAGTLQSSFYLKHAQDTKFNTEYFAKTGIPWRGDYPPIIPQLPIYSAGKHVGERTHTVTFRDRPDGNNTASLIALSTGAPEGPVAFLIEDLLSEEECRHVIELSDPRLIPARVGTANSDLVSSRRSSHAFINRGESPQLELIHQRFADVLGVTDEELRDSAEPLQVVKYKQGEEYSPHHDYASNMHTDGGRLATLLVYLDKAEKGGGTSFPRAAFGRGVLATPRPGSAVLFYSKLSDGNLDELSAHAGVIVESGVKRVCNLWMHSKTKKQVMGALNSKSLEL